MSRALRIRFAMHIAFALTVAMIAAQAAVSQPLVRVAIVGAVTDSGATVAAWVRAGASARVEYSADSSLSSGVTVIEQFSAPTSSDSMFKVRITNLAPSTRYYYRVVERASAEATATRSFATFPRAGVDAPVSFFFGSCQQSSRDVTGAVFDVAANLGADMFVQMGDWAYPDVRIATYPHSDSAVEASYRDRLDTIYPFTDRVLSFMPLAHVWDDHDSFGNNSDGSSPADVKERVTRAYRTYVPHYPLANPEGGIWQALRIGNVDVFMLDSRSQRSPIDSAIRGNQFIPPPGHSMLAGFPVGGVDQRTWLLDALRRSNARWKVIVSPVPFNPAMAPGIALALFGGRRDIAKGFAEYWVGYPADVDSLSALLRSSYGHNVVIVSGSAHTNMYDDGTHSVVPEFVAANLDIPNSNLADTLKRYGLNVWTAAQTGTNNTVGRIRVETKPAHRLIMESFDEAGQIELQYVVVDTATSAVPDGYASRSDSTDDVLIMYPNPANDQVSLSWNSAPPGPRHATMYDLRGRAVRESAPIGVGFDDGPYGYTFDIADLPPGTYECRACVIEECRNATFNIVR